jgi:hypothetical protein
MILSLGNWELAGDIAIFKEATTTKYSLNANILHAFYATNASNWPTRGWTYQERFLSKRHLFFTTQQVTFACNGMYAAESINQPAKLMNR